MIVRWCDTEVRTGTLGTDAVRTKYVHTPGLPVTHPAVSLIHVSLSEGHTLLCGSLRLHLFPSSLYYS